MPVRVDIRPADSGGCGTYRLIHPATVLRDAGHDVVLHDHHASIDSMRSHALPGHTVSVDLDADVIVLQRPLARDLVELIPALQRNGTAVVVEVDDDFHAIPVGHPTRREVSPDRHPERNKLWLRRACEIADLVTVSTSALAEVYGSHGRVVVLENCVPAAYLDITAEKIPDSFGWTGSTHTHVGDLGVVGDAARRLVDEGHQLHIVGTGVGVGEELGVGDRFTTTSWVPIERYPHEYARLEVAMVPLVESRFNAGKSWLKGLEAAALGVPFVASPTPEYRRLNGMGAGWLADKPDTWWFGISALLTSAQMRETKASEDRAVAAEWTYERRAWRWAEAWDLAVKNHHYRRAAA